MHYSALPAQHYYMQITIWNFFQYSLFLINNKESYFSLKQELSWIKFPGRLSLFLLFLLIYKLPIHINLSGGSVSSLFPFNRPLSKLSSAELQGNEMRIWGISTIIHKLRTHLLFLFPVSLYKYSSKF